MLLEGDGPKLLSRDGVVSEITTAPRKGSLGGLPQPFKRNVFSTKATKYSLSLIYICLIPYWPIAFLRGVVGRNGLGDLLYA